MENDELITQVIRAAFLNQYIYSKTKFDNAKDTTALIEAADESVDMMLTAAKVRMIQYADELVVRKLEDTIEKTGGKFVVRLSDGTMCRVRVQMEKEQADLEPVRPLHYTWSGNSRDPRPYNDLDAQKGPIK